MGEARIGTHLLSHACTWGWGLLFQLEGMQPFPSRPPQRACLFPNSLKVSTYVSLSSREKDKGAMGMAKRGQFWVERSLQDFHFYFSFILPGMNYYGHCADWDTEAQRDEEAPLSLPS